MMISIIICSRNQFISNNLWENINSTVGCDCELIIIDNSEGQYSIFQAYNIGIKKSIGDYLCFMHDDIFFHSHDWGVIINRLFKEYPDYGLIGVAGANMKTKIPTGWWDCESKYKSVNIIQKLLNGNTEKQYLGFENTKFNEVVVIDGVFMVLRKNTNIFFNEELKGFHNYDLNISLETFKKGYKVGVTNEILIEHFSKGTLNKDWLKSTINIHKKYKNLLPITIANNDVVSTEVFGGERFVNHCFRIEGKKKMYLFTGHFFNKSFFSKTHFFLVRYFIINFFKT